MDSILNEYQIEAVNRMKNGCILNGGTGTGKSRTGLYYYFKENGGYAIDYFKPMVNPQDLYIITTAMKRDSAEWDYELSLFVLSRDPELNMYSNKVVIDSWNNIEKYKDIENSFFIFDEDKVTGKGKWAHTFLKIVKKNNWIILSATPGDTWLDYVTVFIANGFFRNRSEFLREHVIFNPYITKYPAIRRYVNTGKLIKLRKSILIDMGNRVPAQKIHNYIYCDYDKELYKKIVKNRCDPINGEPFENATTFCLALRQAVNSNPSRIEVVENLVREYERVIIFYNYNYELDILKSIDYGPDVIVAEWNGRRHDELPKSEKFVYLTQYNAGCEGWNCIRTNVIIFYSQNYSYKMMTQAAGRIERMNTPFSELYYYHLTSESGIDKAISEALMNKKEFNEKKFVYGG